MVTHNFEKSTVIDKDVDTVYRIWSNFEKFPKFMKHIRSVEKKDNNVAHWTVEGPFDTMIEWDTEIHVDRQERKIEWSGIGGDIDAGGEVKLDPAGEEQTEVKLSLKFEPKSGLAASIFQSMFGNPGMHVDYSLQKFKEYAEKQKN